MRLEITNRTIPTATTARWDSTFHQQQAINKLDRRTLKEVCGEEFNEAALSLRDRSQQKRCAKYLLHSKKQQH